MIKEKFLHYLWKNKIIFDKELILSNGEKLEIISYGHYNTQSGPDFFNAHLKIGNLQWVGNVEMHVKSSLWYAHGHEKDISYGNVILHVVWQHDVEIFDYQQNKIPTLELKPIISETIIEQYNQLLKTPFHFIPCENQTFNINHSFFTNWLERVYLQRLEAKSQRIAYELQKTQNDWEAIFFQFLMRNFGGNINGEAFESVAKNTPFAIIRKELHSAQNLEALLLGQLQLLSEPTTDSYHSDLKKEYQYQQQKYHLPVSNISAQFFKLRPANFPTIRVSQLAHLYGQHQQLFEKCLKIDSINEFYKLFEKISTSEYWQNHYTFGKESGRKIKKISTSQIELIWINTIVPIQYTYNQFVEKKPTCWVTKVKDVRAEKNTILEKYEKLKFPNKNACQSQALLELYKKYCTPHQCLECNIGKKILNQNFESDF